MVGRRRRVGMGAEWFGKLLEESEDADTGGDDGVGSGYSCVVEVGGQLEGR